MILHFMLILNKSNPNQSSLSATVQLHYQSFVRLLDHRQHLPEHMVKDPHHIHLAERAIIPFIQNIESHPEGTRNVDFQRGIAPNIFNKELVHSAPDIIHRLGVQSATNVAIFVLSASLGTVQCPINQAIDGRLGGSRLVIARCPVDQAGNDRTPRYGTGFGTVQ